MRVGVCECLHARDGNEDSEDKAACPRSLSTEGEQLDSASSALLTAPQSVPDALMLKDHSGVCCEQEEEALSHPVLVHFTAGDSGSSLKLKP